MPWYKSGTVSVTLNSNVVTGSGTAFIANCRVGDAFRGPDGRWYEVTNASSNTALSIDPAYLGATVSGGGYALAPMQGYVKDSADALRALVNTWGAQLAALGTTGNYDVLPVSKGGTGGTSQPTARSGLGLGNAAVATLQTSPSDTTAGRPMTPGAFGIGGATIPILESDLDVERVNGRYNVQASNAGKLPVNANGYLTHWNNPSTGYAFQTFRPVTGTREYTRTQVAGTWGAWVIDAQGVVPVVQGGTGGTDQATARTGLGLGTAATQNTGTSGATVPLLNGTNSWSGAQTFLGVNTFGATGAAPVMGVQVSSTQGRIYMMQETALSMLASVNSPNSAFQPLKIASNNTFPHADNYANFGNGTFRWAGIFAASGTINTSDAREKTEVAPLTEAELSAAKVLAKEVGTYKWLASIDSKGDEARMHVGMTVQRVMEIMSSYGLNPLEYAFICYDEWPGREELFTETATGNVYFQGELVASDVDLSTFEPYASDDAYTWEETSRVKLVTQEAAPAGNRYGFRYDQLALFIARGQEERIARLEARLIPAA